MPPCHGICWNSSNALVTFACPYHLFKNYEALFNWKLGLRKEKMFKVEKKKKKSLRLNTNTLKWESLFFFIFFPLFFASLFFLTSLKNEIWNTSWINMCHLKFSITNLIKWHLYFFHSHSHLPPVYSKTQSTTR